MKFVKKKPCQIKLTRFKLLIRPGFEEKITSRKVENPKKYLKDLKTKIKKILPQQ